MRRGSLEILLAAAVLAMGGCGKAPAPPAAPPQGNPPPPVTDQPSTSPEKTADPGSEELAKALIEEVRNDRHQVCVRYPFTVAGREAAGRCVAAETAAREAFEREFQEARRTVEEICKEGRIADAVERWGEFLVKTAKEPLRRRAEAEIALLENEAVRAYNDGVRKARDRATAGAFDESAALLESAAKGSTPEVREALAEDLAALGRRRRRAADRRGREAAAAAESGFRDRARRILDKARARKYEEALADLDAAILEPAQAPVREVLEADRACLAAAAAFWDAVLKNLRGRLNQDASFLLLDGKSTRGVVKRIFENGITLQVDANSREVAFSALHTDQLILLAFGRGGLQDGSGESYSRAAMWFFLEGKDALARLELATAAELGADIGSLESAWRRGLLRAALGR